MKYTEETIEGICKELREGATQLDAAIVNGICKDTFYDWMKNKPDFSDRIKNALADFKSELLTTIKKASPKSWQAAAWILERRFRQDYALRTELTGKDGEKLEIPTPVILNVKTNPDKRPSISSITEPQKN